ALDKLRRSQLAKVLKRGEQLVVRPVPPCERVHAGTDPGVESVADQPGRYPADDGVGSHILRHDGTCTNYGAVANRDARQHCRAMADPDVMSDRHTIAAAPLEEVDFIGRAFEIVSGTVGE